MLNNQKKKRQKSNKTIGDFEQVAKLAVDIETNKAKLKAARTGKINKTRNQN